MNISILRKVKQPFRATEKSASVDFYVPEFDEKFIIDFLILNKFLNKVKIDKEEDTSTYYKRAGTAIYQDPITKEKYSYEQDPNLDIQNNIVYKAGKNNKMKLIYKLRELFHLSNLNIKLEDLYTDYKKIIDTEYIYIYPHQTLLIPSGVCTRIPDNYFLFLIDKSGIAVKENLKTNGGIIDQDFKLELGFIIFNTTNETKKIKADQRLVQGILIPCLSEAISEVKYEDLYTDLKSDRNGGFGSTGLK